MTKATLKRVQAVGYVRLSTAGQEPFARSPASESSDARIRNAIPSVGTICGESNIIRCIYTSEGR